MQFDWEAFTYDESWLGEAVRLESKLTQDVQIEVQTSRPPTIEPTSLKNQLKQVKILSMLFGELHRLLEQANLGYGTEAALVKGRQLIQVRVSQLSLKPQTSLEALLAQEANPTERSFKAQLSLMLCVLLSESDWQEIAQAAIGSIQVHLLELVSQQQPRLN